MASLGKRKNQHRRLVDMSQPMNQPARKPFTKSVQPMNQPARKPFTKSVHEVEIGQWRYRADFDSETGEATRTILPSPNSCVARTSGRTLPSSSRGRFTRRRNRTRFTSALSKLIRTPETLSTTHARAQ